MKTTRQDLKVYLPTDKINKTNIRGFWKGERGLSYDYLRQVYITEGQQGYLIKRHKQEALFYTKKGRAYTWYNPRRVEERRFWTTFGYNKHTRGLKAFLKDILATYGGFTIYIREANYLVEVWK